MKRLYLLVVLIFLSLCSCNRIKEDKVDFISLEDIPAEMVESGLHVSKDESVHSIHFSSSGNWFIVINVISGPSNWLKVEPVTGSPDSGVITLHISENTEYEDREAQIGFYSGTAKQLLAITQEGDRYVEFADVAVQKDCLNSFDSDKDGRISYLEAEMVTDVSGCFEHSNEYVSFHEFRYFTSVKVLPDNSFSNAKNLKGITLPDNLTKIGRKSFYNCNSLEQIVLPSSISIIDGNAFENCFMLKSIILPEGLKELYGAVFKNCNNLKEVSFPNNLSFISSECFMNCTSLESVNLPDNITQLDERQFKGCTSLKNVKLPQKLINMSEAFSGCTSLDNIELPSSLIATFSAFENCTSLTNIVLPENMSNIGIASFRGCKNLKSITISKTGFIFIDQTAFDDTCNCPIYVKETEKQRYTENFPFILNRIIWY